MIFWAEAKRFFVNIRFIAVCLAVTVVSLAWMGYTVHSQLSFGDYESEYRDYCTRWQGELTKQKQDEIENEYNRINETAAAEQNNKKLYEQGKMSREDYAKYLEELDYAQSKLGAIERFYEYYENIKANGKGYIIYDTYWNYVFSLYPSLFVLALAAFMIIPTAAGDFSSGMWRLTVPTAKGVTSLTVTRIAVIALFCAVFQTVFSAVQYIFMSAAFELPSPNFPLQSLTAFSGIKQSVSILQFYILLSVARLLFLALTSVIIFAVTMLIRNLMLSIGTVMVVSLLPAVSQSAVPTLYLYSPLSAIDSCNLITSGSLPIALIGYAVVTCLTVILALRRAK